MKDMKKIAIYALTPQGASLGRRINFDLEGDLFFQDLSNEILTDDLFARLLTFPNVLVTGHQAFLTDRALRNIAETTLHNISEMERAGRCDNQATLADVRGT